MADEELELDLDTPTTEDFTREKDRNKKLADKVKLTSEEREAEKARADKAEAERQTAQKDAEFYKNFNSLSTKYQGANEYQDKIREKVMSGYELEDATISILAKEGKYTPTAPTPDKITAAGGSANTTMQSGGGKTPEEMNQTERKAALEEAFAKGEISI